MHHGWCIHGGSTMGLPTMHHAREMSSTPVLFDDAPCTGAQPPHEAACYDPTTHTHPQLRPIALRPIAITHSHPQPPPQSHEHLRPNPWAAAKQSHA